MARAFECRRWPAQTAVGGKPSPIHFSMEHTMNSPAVEQTGQLGRGMMGLNADIARRTFEGFEQLTHLNLQTVKTTLVEQREIAEEAVTSNSLEWVASLPAAQTQAAMKKALAYWRHASNIAIETAADNVGSGWCSFNEYAHWTASWVGGAASTVSESARRVLAGPTADLRAEAAAEAQAQVETASTFTSPPTSTSAGGKSGGKGRSAQLVGSEGNAPSPPNH
jgi:phasin family protein